MRLFGEFRHRWPHREDGVLFFPSILLNSTLLEWMVGKRWVKGEEGEYYVVVRAIKKLSIRVHFKSSYIRGVLGCIGRTFRIRNVVIVAMERSQHAFQCE